MTTNLPRLRDLERRLTEATGADRELDALIVEVIGGQLLYDLKRWNVLWPYTASLDAIVALIERTLPGWDRTSGRIGGRWQAAMRERYPKRGFDGDGAASEALALCLALVRALIAREEGRTC